MSVQYKVYLTPRSGLNEYGDEIEVTDWVKDGGASNIRRGLDSTDYDIGGFYYDDVQLTLVNENGKFNDESDFRSIFPFSRDLCKARLEYTDSDGSTIVFKGLVNEEATRLDATKEEIQFRVLSSDSVMRSERVAAGVITDGVLMSAAMKTILNQAGITAILNFDESNINPSTDLTIDNGAALEGKSVREAMSQLLLVANSVMYVDGDDNIIVASRLENTDAEILNLYGAYDLKRRQNIIDIRNYNQGKQRMFTAVRVNDTETANVGYVQQFGYRQKKISAPFITDPEKEALIGAYLVEEFKTPKIELEVSMPTKVARGVSLLQRVSIDSPLRIKVQSGKFLPIVGQAVIGDTMTPLPDKFGSVSIPPAMGFKIIEIKEDPKNFQTTLKLRQIGSDTGDGYYTSSDCAIIGFATIGVSTICGTGDPADTFNPSVIGAAVIGLTETA